MRHVVVAQDDVESFSGTALKLGDRGISEAEGAKGFEGSPDKLGQDRGPGAAVQNERDAVIVLGQRICNRLGPPPEIGDVVTIYGSDGEHLLPTNGVARGIGTVTSDLMCAVSARVTRVYTE